MASQPVPEVTPEDVERIVRRDYASADSAAAMALLERYGEESWHREIDRVRLAALKLAAGDLARLSAQVDSACGDYRDVLGAAEFPRYLDRYDKNLDDEHKREIIDADWKEYQQWLTT